MNPQSPIVGHLLITSAQCFERYPNDRLTAGIRTFRSSALSQYRCHTDTIPMSLDLGFLE